MVDSRSRRRVFPPFAGRGDWGNSSRNSDRLGRCLGQIWPSPVEFGFWARTTLAQMSRFSNQLRLNPANVGRRMTKLTCNGAIDCPSRSRFGRFRPRTWPQLARARVKFSPTRPRLGQFGRSRPEFGLSRRTYGQVDQAACPTPVQIAGHVGRIRPIMGAPVADLSDHTFAQLLALKLVPGGLVGPFQPSSAGWAREPHNQPQR